MRINRLARRIGGRRDDLRAVLLDGVMVAMAVVLAIAIGIAVGRFI